MAKKILKGIGRVAGGVVGGSLAKIILGGGKGKAKVEAPEPVMPIADDEAVRLARKRSIARQLNRGGRESTILTDTLGG